VTVKDLVECDPDVIVVAPCGLDLKKPAREMGPVVESEWWAGLQAVKRGAVFLVDGNQMFNRPGPRLVDALEWLCSILNDDCMQFPGVAGFPAVPLSRMNSLL